MKSMRWPALVLIPALVIGAALLSTSGGARTPPADQTAAAGAQLPARDALSAVWFCGGGTGIPSGAADHTVTIINTTDAARTGTVTAYGSRGTNGAAVAPVARPVALAAYARVDFRLGDLVATPYVAATVEMYGGGVLVEHAVNGPLGNDRGPCTSRASSTWYLPLGATATAAANAPSREFLTFFNPFPGDAVVDATFSTENGPRGTPEMFKGLVVPGGSVVGIDLASAGVTVASEVAASVTTRTGRVVVDRIQAFDEATRRGIAVTTALSRPSDAWVYPSGSLSAGRQERLVVYNPNAVAADVDVQVRPRSPDVGIVPFRLTVQPNAQSVLDLGAESRLADVVASPDGYSILVRTSADTPIVTERLATVPPGTPGAGVAVDAGQAAGALHLVADVVAGDPAASRLVLMNPSARSIAQVSLWTIANGVRAVPANHAHVELQPGEQIALPVNELGAGAFTIDVQSSGLVIGSLEIVTGTDRSLAPAVPDATSAAPPDHTLFDTFGG